MGKTSQRQLVEDWLYWREKFFGDDPVAAIQNFTEKDFERLRAVGYALGTQVLMDFAAGLVPNSTEAQRADAAKELRKEMQQAGDAASRTLQDLGRDALRSHLEDLQKTEKRIIQQEPEPAKADGPPVLE